MALASVSYPTDGVADTFAVPFEYVNRNDVTVYLNDVSVPFTWVTTSSIKLFPKPSAGLIVRIQRHSALETKPVNFQAGAVLPPGDLKKDSDHAFFLIQEMRDDIENIEAGTLSQTTIDQLKIDIQDSTLSSTEMSDLLGSSSVRIFQQAEPPVHTEDKTGKTWVVTISFTPVPPYPTYCMLRHWDGYEWAAGATVQTWTGSTNPESNQGYSSQEGQLWWYTTTDTLYERQNGQWVAINKDDYFWRTTEPYTLADGSIWYDSNDNNKSYRFDLFTKTWEPLVVSIHGSLVVDGSIVSSKINAGEIGAHHLSVTQLDAISADMGSLTAGNLTLRQDSLPDNGTRAWILAGSADPDTGLVPYGYYEWTDWSYTLIKTVNDRTNAYDAYDHHSGGIPNGALAVRYNYPWGSGGGIIWQYDSATEQWTYGSFIPIMNHVSGTGAPDPFAHMVGDLYHDTSLNRYYLKTTSTFWMMVANLDTATPGQYVISTNDKLPTVPEVDDIKNSSGWKVYTDTSTLVAISIPPDIVDTSLPTYNVNHLWLSSTDTYPLWFGQGARNDANGKFYVKDDGSVVFKGELQAASGTFSGDISAATGSFGGSLNAATGTFSGTLTADAVNAVNTVNIAGNAVTVPSAGSDSNLVTVNASATLNVLSVPHENMGGEPVIVMAHVIAGGSYGNTDGNLRIYRGATLIYDAAKGFPAGSYDHNAMVMDYPGIGSHTYTIQIYNNGGIPINVGLRTLLGLGVRK